MYDIRDVVKKGIELAGRKRQLYEKLQENNGDVRVRTLLNILISAVDTDIKHYENMIKNITNDMADDIDFGTYDKISSLMNQFSGRFILPPLENRQEIVAFAIELEKSVYALLVDIKGRLITSEAITNSVSYYVLVEMIDDKAKFIHELEIFRKP